VRSGTRESRGNKSKGNNIKMEGKEIKAKAKI
jgi:hypothetical protein